MRHRIYRAAVIYKLRRQEQRALKASASIAAHASRRRRLDAAWPDKSADPHVLKRKWRWYVVSARAHAR